MGRVGVFGRKIILDFDINNYISSFMVISKSHTGQHHSLSVDDAAQSFAAIGSTARLQILLVLVRAGNSGLGVGEIKTHTNMAASTLAHHLKFLTSAGLVEQEKIGRSIINRAVFHHLESLASYILMECCVDEKTKFWSQEMSEISGEFKPASLLALHHWKSLLFTPWTIVISVPIAVFAFDRENTITVISFAINALISTFGYILFAVLLLSWLKAARAESMVANAFKGREMRMIVLASLFGGLAPFCSCEVIPFIAGLLALGAPLSAVMAFWLSSPLIDPPTVLITAAALGWPFAIGKAASAVLLGLFGGLVIKLFARMAFFTDPLRIRIVTNCGCAISPADQSVKWRIWENDERRQIFKSEFIQNALFLIKWLALAYVLEAILVTYVPSELIVKVVGGQGIGAIIVAAFAGMPAYLNGYVAPPMLAGLVEQGMSSGAAMSFMIAGSVSSIPAMAAVWSLVKPPVFATYLGLGISGAIISGIVFQSIL